MRAQPSAVRWFLALSLALAAAGCGAAGAGPLVALVGLLVMGLGVYASGCPADSRIASGADANGPSATGDNNSGPNSVDGASAGDSAALDASADSGDIAIVVASPDSGGVVSPDDDWDGDGVPNATDNCPWAENTLQQDTDDDLVGDACDTCDYPNYMTPCGDPCCYDADGDGINGGGELPPGGPDNCPFVANPDQGDADGDGMGDACDPDYAMAPAPARWNNIGGVWSPAFAAAPTRRPDNDDVRWGIIARLRASGTLSEQVVSLLEQRA